MSTRRERVKEPIVKMKRQLMELNEMREARQAQSRKNLHTAELYFDIAKLIFGGVVIGTIVDPKEYWMILLAIGLVLFFALLWVGNKYYNLGNQNN